MEPAALVERLKQEFGERIVAADPEALDVWAEIPPEALPEVAQRLCEDDAYDFNFLHCITVVDYFEPDAKKAAKVDWEPHLEVLYHLSSMRHRHRLVLKIKLSRWKNDQPGQLPELATVSHLWRTALWHEREVFDLSGVRFAGHPDLRRILCPEDWVGHPLRKDYEMPTEYHGIRAR